MKHVLFAFSVVLLFFSNNLNAGPNIANNSLSIFKSSTKVRSADLGFDYVKLTLDDKEYKKMFNQRSETLVIEIPYVDGEMITLYLQRVDVVTKDFIMKDSNLGSVPYTPGLFYRGRDEYGGLAAISFFEGNLMGMVSLVGGNGVLNIGRMENVKSGNEFVMFNDKFLPYNGFECGAEKLPNYHERVKNAMENNRGNTRSVMSCVNMYLEGSYSLFQNKGGVQEATDYLLGMWNPCATIFDNEGVTTAVSEIMIWSSTDPYTGNDSAFLNEFQNQNPSFNGDLAHLCYLFGPGGGLAYVDVLCNPNFAYAYSNINPGYNNFPSYSWTVNVVAHEAGHNLGSPHTQSCSWPGGAIDGCVSSEGSCADGPVPSCGTIMSYCHAAPPFCIDFNQGFGPLPGDLIEDKFNGAGCLGGCDWFSGVAEPEAEFDFTLFNECTNGPGEVWFTDLSENADSWYWEFEGGDPAISFDQNPVVIYNQAGVFDVTLTVYGDGGEDSETKNSIIEIFNGPYAEFTVTVVDNLVFTTNNSAFADEYEWDFGNGDDSGAFDPVYEYEDDGVYTITLYAISDDCGFDEYEVEVTIATAPSAGLSMDTTWGCAPLNVAFNNGSSSNVADYLWLTPGAEPDTSYVPSPTVSYDSSGVYPVTLIVSNPQGADTLTYLDTITVLDIPTGDFGYTVAADTVHFTDMTDAADSLYWDFGDGSFAINEISPSHGYTSSDTFEVILHSTNLCGTQYDTSYIFVQLLPVAGFNQSGDGGCANYSVDFENSSLNADSISWFFPGGDPEVSDAEMVTVTYDAAGIYDVYLYAFNELGTDTVELVSAVDVIDVPSSIFNVNQNSSTNFDFIAEDQGADSYEWDFGDGSTSADANPNHEYTNPDIYTVTLITTNECGTTSTEQEVTVSLVPVVSFTSDAAEGCVPMSIQFTNTSFAGETFEWSFPGGMPATSSDENPTVVYNEAGTFDVSLVVSNQFGTSEETYSAFVQINDVPEVDFSFNVDGAMIELMAIGNAENWDWDLGDGMTAIGPNNTYTYAEEGTYTITLIGSNECGEASASYTIDAYSDPTAGFEVPNSIYCVGDAITMTNTSSVNVTEYNWSFPGADTETSDDAEPTITYSNTGTYDISLTVSNPVGEDETALTEVITIIDVPSAGFIANGIQLEYSFENTSEGADNCVWDFGDGTTSTDVNPTHTYLTEGEFTVSLTCSNMCGETTSTQDIMVSLAPVAIFTYEIIEPCAPAQIQFFNNSSGNVQMVEWAFEGGNPATSTDPDPIVTFDNAGMFNVSLTVTDGITPDMTMDVVEVVGLPESGMNITTDGPVVMGTAEGDFNFEWYYNNDLIGVSPMMDYTFSENGSYEIILEASNECGTSSYTQIVEINAFPDATFNAVYEDQCAPGTVDLIGTETEGSTYEWTMNGGAIIADPTSPVTTATIDASGEYSVAFTVTNDYGTESSTQMFQFDIIPEPFAQINFQFEDGIFIGESEDDNATSHEWDFGNGDSLSGKDVEYTYSEPGVYVITLTVMNDCGTDTESFTVEVQTSNVNDPSLVGISLYPNPAQEQIIVELPQEMIGTQMSILNVQGQIVMKETLINAKNTINLEALSSGLYLVKYSTEEWIGSERLIKVK